MVKETVDKTNAQYGFTNSCSLAAQINRKDKRNVNRLFFFPLGNCPASELPVTSCWMWSVSVCRAPCKGFLWVWCYQFSDNVLIKWLNPRLLFLLVTLMKESVSDLCGRCVTEPVLFFYCKRFFPGAVTRNFVLLIKYLFDLYLFDGLCS